MNNFFNLDNPIFTFLSKVCDLLFLSIVWVLLCIPVITIGPANTALYYAVVKVVRRERGYLFREFFKSFRLNFKRGAIIGVILTIIFAVLAFDIYLSWGNIGEKGKQGSIMLGVFVAITVLTLCFSLYIFPILSRFDMTIMQLIKAAIFMSIKHLPYTIGMVAVTIAVIVGTAFFQILIFFAPAVCVLINSLLMERILKKYVPQAANTDDEDAKKDEWYLE